MNSSLTRAGLLCAIFGALMMIMPPSARSAVFVVDFPGTARCGHEFSLIDSHGKVVSLGTATPQHYQSEWKDRDTLEVMWLADGLGIESAYVPDPEAWYPTGAWQFNTTWLFANFDEHLLTLTPDTVYYFYDNNTNEYSDACSFNEGNQIMAPENSNMHAGWPILPIRTIGGGLKVFGKARFNSAVRIAPAGDLSMGEFTHEPAN